MGAIAGALICLGYTQRKKIMSSIKSLSGFNKQTETLPKVLTHQLSETFCKTSSNSFRFSKSIKKRFIKR